MQSKVRRESETHVLELRSQLEMAKDKITKLENSHVALKAEVIAFEEVCIIDFGWSGKVVSGYGFMIHEGHTV